MTIYNIHGLQALCDGPQTPTECKSESVTDGLTRLYKVPIKTRVFLDKSSLREIFKNEDRDFLHPGTRRGGVRAGKKRTRRFFKKVFFSKTI